MPIGIVSDTEFEEELRRISVPSVQKTEQPVVIEPLTKDRGRAPGDNNVPESLRKIIGETAVINGRQEALQLASDFGISASSASAYAKGATSTTSYNSPAESIISHINKSRRRAIKRASSTLNSALSAITQDKLDYADAKDLSVIAKNMSAIIKDLEPPQSSGESSSQSTPQFVIFAPQFRKEESFEVIQINE